MAGWSFARDLYLTAGVRRLALDYEIQLGDLPRFTRSPGFWDPLIGIGWHRKGDTFEIHGTFEGGGFGVGADVDLGGGLRVDWKPIPHFGFTAGYGFLYYKVTDERSNRVFKGTQSMHGPLVGIGLYF